MFFGGTQCSLVLTVVVCCAVAPPSFAVTPRDKQVGVNRQVAFRCEVTGNPPPAVFWNRQSSEVSFTASRAVLMLRSRTVNVANLIHTGVTRNLLSGVGAKKESGDAVTEPFAGSGA